MMTREEELQRLYEDRDILEQDIEDWNWKMRDLEEDSEEWNELFDAITSAENEVSYINSCIEDLGPGAER